MAGAAEDVTRLQARLRQFVAHKAASPQSLTEEILSRPGAEVNVLEFCRLATQKKYDKVETKWYVRLAGMTKGEWASRRLPAFYVYYKLPDWPGTFGALCVIEVKRNTNDTEESYLIRVDSSPWISWGKNVADKFQVQISAPLDYHVIVTNDYGYQMEDPNQVARQCRFIFEQARQLLPSGEGYPGISYAQDSIDLLTASVQTIAQLLLRGNQQQLAELYNVTGVSIRRTDRDGVSREFQTQLKWFEHGRREGAGPFVTKSFQADEFAIQGENIVQNHVDTFQQLKSRNKQLTFAVSLWEYRNKAEYQAPLGTTYLPLDDGIYNLTSAAETPGDVFIEDGQGAGKTYDIGSDLSERMQQTQCGQVLFTAAVPHRGNLDIPQRLIDNNIECRYNIMFYLEPKRGLQGVPRMFRVVEGRAPAPAYEKGEDGRWRKIGGAGTQQPDRLPQTATHLKW